MSAFSLHWEGIKRNMKKLIQSSKKSLALNQV